MMRGLRDKNNDFLPLRSLEQARADIARDSQKAGGGQRSHFTEDRPRHTVASCPAEGRLETPADALDVKMAAVGSGKRDAAARTVRMREEIRHSRARLWRRWKPVTLACRAIQETVK